MKARMRELNIKMTELSEYIKVSRPTLYKYIESYESGNLESIPDRVVSLFRLMDNPDVTKEQVVTFTITTFSEGDSTDPKDVIRRYLSDPSSSADKTELMYKLATTDCIDGIIPYLNDCIDILENGVKDDDEAYQVARLVLLRSRLAKNKPLKDEELREAKEILEGSHGH